MKKLLWIAGVAIALAGCGQEEARKLKELQGEVTKLQQEVATLERALDEERNGAARLLATGQTEMKAGEWAKAEFTLSKLIKRHPETEPAAAAKPLLAKAQAQIKAIEAKQKAEQAKKAEEERRAIARADRNLVKDVDEVREITWFHHKNEPSREKKMALYFGKKEGEDAQRIRMRLMYKASEWLFVQSVTIKADSQTFELSRVSFERDNGYGGIWEWMDEPVYDLERLQAILNAKRVIIRFVGRQYHSDFELPADQKAAMKEMLLAWQRYGGKK